MALLLPRSGRGLVVFTNGDNGFQLYNNLIKKTFDFGPIILAKMAGIENRKIINLKDFELESFSGDFLDSYGRKLSVSTIENGLKVAGEGVPTNSIYPIAPNIFVLADFDVEFIFTSHDQFSIFVDGKKDCDGQRLK